MNRYTFATKDLLTAGVIALAMILASLLLFKTPQPSSSFGICLPSPGLWQLSPTLSLILNLTLIFGSVPLLSLLNKRYILVQGGSMLLTMTYMILLAGNPFITLSFNTSTLLLIVNIISMGVLFETFRKRNSTQDYFFIATLLSVGSMMQYSFVPMIIVYLSGWAIMGTLKIKDLLAFIMGLIAPYWVALGLGIIQVSDFRLPQLVNIFTDSHSRIEWLVMMIGTGIVFLISTLLSLNNAVRLYAGNSRIRKCNNAMNVLGYLCALCMIIDFNNITAYLASFYLWSAVQIGNFFYFNRIGHPHLLAWILCALYTVQCVLIIL